MPVGTAMSNSVAARVEVRVDAVCIVTEQLVRCCLARQHGDWEPKQKHTNQSQYYSPDNNY
eukprot:1471622-Amphidinium_carterae.1